VRTPGPWVIKYEYNVFGPNERGVAACGGYQSNVKTDNVHKENKANAAFIVRCVNSHESSIQYFNMILTANTLVEAIDYARKALSEMQPK